MNQQQTAKNPSPDWLVPASLIFLALVPVLAGLVRVVELSTDPAVTPENARFVSDPLPIVVHLLSVIFFSVAGAFQFSKQRRQRQWHRQAGKLLIPAGIIGATTGLWLSVMSDLPERDNTLLMVFRVGFGLAMLGALVAGTVTIYQQQYAKHGAWMRRGYAIGLGAGTQAFTVGGWTLTQGDPTGNTRAWLFFAGWAINLVLAEWHNRKQPARPTQPRPSDAFVPTLCEQSQGIYVRQS